MVEIYKIISDLSGLFQLADVFHFIIPHAGVGGGVEAKEYVPFVPLIKNTLLFLAGIGTVFGIGLAITAKKFAVKIDPRVEKVLDTLAHAHCGACGFAGCEQYAEAVVNKSDVPPNLCTPGGIRTAEAVALITGKKAASREPNYSRIMCKGGWTKSVKKFRYEGVQDCRAVMLAGGGDKTCAFGCLGYGTCSSICPFGAITMTKDHLPQVDIQKCTGCRKCEAACPRKVIQVLPASRQVLVACSSRDKGVETKKNCQVGCIGCGICIKVCPFEAPSLEHNLSGIHPDKCTVCGLCATKCPTGAISDLIPRRPKAFIKDTCIGCRTCAKVCPVNAASGELKKMHRIDDAKCIGCGICTAKCPVLAIDGTFNAKKVFSAAEKKKTKAA